MGNTSLEVRALGACQRYAAAALAVQDFTHAIGVALEECPNQPEGIRPGFLESRKTHLTDFYNKPSTDPVGDQPGESRWDETVGECDACERAYDLVEKRKDARKVWGAAKRQVRAVGMKARADTEEGP